jgi:hypothetical protein
MGHFDQALADFSQAIDSQSEAGWAVTDRGETYRPQPGIALWPDVDDRRCT